MRKANGRAWINQQIIFSFGMFGMKKRSKFLRGLFLRFELLRIFCKAENNLRKYIWTMSKFCLCVLTRNLLRLCITGEDHFLESKKLMCYGSENEIAAVTFLPKLARL